MVRRFISSSFDHIRIHTHGYIYIKVRMLLNWPGVDVNLPDGEGVTLLHICCKDQDVDTAVLLLLRGANPLAENEDGETPLMVSDTK